MPDVWVRATSRATLPEGATLVRVANEAVVIRVFGERVVAFAAFCPHMLGPMLRAEIKGLVVSCPLHGWRFDLEDEGRELHGYRSLRIYPVRLDGDDVLIQLQAPSSDPAWQPEPHNHDR